MNYAVIIDIYNQWNAVLQETKVQKPNQAIIVHKKKPHLLIRIRRTQNQANIMIVRLIMQCRTVR